MPLPCDDDLHQHTTYRISLSLLLSYQTYPKAARLASLLPPSPLHTPPRICGTADSQAADHASCAATPARKRDTRLAAAGFRPPLWGFILASVGFILCREKARCLANAPHPACFVFRVECLDDTHRVREKSFPYSGQRRSTCEYASTPLTLWYKLMHPHDRSRAPHMLE